MSNDKIFSEKKDFDITKKVFKVMSNDKNIFRK